MKISFFVNEFPSLSETFILSQIVGLIKLGHRVDVYARNTQNASKTHPLVEQYQLQKNVFYHPFIPANYLVRLVKGFWLFTLHIWKNPAAMLGTLNIKEYGRHASSLKLLYRAVPLVQRNCPEYDIIMCHFGSTGLVALDLKRLGLIKGKLCVTFHGLDVSAFLKEAGEDVYTPLFAEGDLMMPISKNWQKRLINLGCSPSAIQVHHMGVDAQQFEFRPRLCQSDEPIRIVTIARLVEKKGVEYGIRALAKVKQDYPQVEYLIIGDGPLRESLTQLIDELSLADTIHLLGWQRQSEVVEILKKSHILIAPSVTSQTGDMEGIPVVLMEAMAMGMPVVSTYHSGIPELVNDGVTGFLVQERDENALADRICHLLKNSAQWPTMGQRARAQIEAEFENTRLNQRLVSIFSALATCPVNEGSIPENTVSTR